MPLCIAIVAFLLLSTPSSARWTGKTQGSTSWLNSDMSTSILSTQSKGSGASDTDEIAVVHQQQQQRMRTFSFSDRDEGKMHWFRILFPNDFHDPDYSPAANSNPAPSPPETHGHRL